MKKPFRITPKFAVGIIGCALLGILAFVLGYAEVTGASSLFKYDWRPFIILGICGLIFGEIIIGAFLKRAHKWGLLAGNVIALFLYVILVDCFEVRSVKPILISAGLAVVGSIIWAGIVFLAHKYEKIIGIAGKIILILVIGALAAYFGYNGLEAGGKRLLSIFYRYECYIEKAFWAIILGQILLGCLWKSARKWGLLSLSLILGSVIGIAEVLTYVQAEPAVEKRMVDSDAVVQGQLQNDTIVEKGAYYNSGKNPALVTAYKPIIYLYPKKTTRVSVQVGNPENLTYTYPVYQDGWRVQATPTGNLTDLQTGRHYYALYWEGKSERKKHKWTEGFVVAKEDTISFLEEKLALLGLTEREADEFIVYWLPKLGESKYNLIRFQTMEEQDEAMPLIVKPKPDTIIRVMMEYRGMNKPIAIYEQDLPDTPKRRGFTLVEWGGTAI